MTVNTLSTSKVRKHLPYSLSKCREKQWVHLEVHALETSPCKPKMWLRHVDNIFAIWPHGAQLLEMFYQHLTSIQFTMERESEVKITFLDVQLERRGTTALTSVFHKKTHMDRFLNFNLYHPAKVFRGVIQCLRVRAENVCDEGKQ